MSVLTGVVLLWFELVDRTCSLLSGHLQLYSVCSLGGVGVFLSCFFRGGRLGSWWKGMWLADQHGAWVAGWLALLTAATG